MRKSTNRPRQACSYTVRQTGKEKVEKNEHMDIERGFLLVNRRRKKKEVWFGQEKGKMGSKEKGKKTQVGRSHDSMTNAVNHYLVQSFQDR